MRSYIAAFALLPHFQWHSVPGVLASASFLSATNGLNAQAEEAWNSKHDMFRHEFCRPLGDMKKPVSKCCELALCVCDREGKLFERIHDCFTAKLAALAKPHSKHRELLRLGYFVIKLKAKRVAPPAERQLASILSSWSVPSKDGPARLFHEDFEDRGLCNRIGARFESLRTILLLLL